MPPKRPGRPRPRAPSALPLRAEAWQMGWLLLGLILLTLAIYFPAWHGGSTVG